MKNTNKISKKRLDFIIGIIEIGFSSTNMTINMRLKHIVKELGKGISSIRKNINQNIVRLTKKRKKNEAKGAIKNIERTLMKTSGKNDYWF
jgi:hypothetical protein